MSGQQTQGTQPRVVVCGLGPGPAALITSETATAAERITHRFVRTRRHPSADALGAAESFDHVYEQADSVDDVYPMIVEHLVAASREHGEVLYAVPGSPTVAEATVTILKADDRVVVEVLPALSFLDLAWDRLDVDPVESGVRLVDGHRFGTEAAGARGPLLVTQCDSSDVLSTIKLALSDLDIEPPPAVVLQRLGLPDESVRRIAWSDLDHEIEPDHLTSVYLPQLAAPVAGELARLDEVMRLLRQECPWDREQTHDSLRRHVLEETYEVLEAIDHLDVEAGKGYEALEEELGDLLIQVYFHATLAAEEGQFTLADVARTVREKLIGRHPHVFGDVQAETADDVRDRWHQIKKAEKGRQDVMEGIPQALPALLYALKVIKRASSEGVDWRAVVDSSEAGGALEAHQDQPLRWRLWALVDEAAGEGLDPETELRLAAEHVRDRFRSS